MTSRHALPLRWAARWAVGLVLLVAAFGAVAALDRGPYSVDILVDGVPLEEYAARATTYIEALEGREYAVRLTNRTSRRVAVALAVDGLNSIDAKTTSAGAASKWILGPHETITLDGWQTTSSTARRFYFTTEDRSYGAWLGKTANLGIVSAAFFRERRPEPAPIYRPPVEERRRLSPNRKGEREGAAPGPGESRDSAGSTRLESRAPEAGRRGEPAPEPADDLAATGIGRRIDHRVRRVRFQAEPSPAAILELRYEYRDALVRLGVLPRPYAHRDDPLQRRERARGFEGFDFAPEPLW